MKKTSQRSLLFRQNVGRTEEEWAHFLDGYRQALSLRLDLGRGGREGDEGLARTRGGYVADQGARAAKMKSAAAPRIFKRTKLQFPKTQNVIAQESKI